MNYTAVQNEIRKRIVSATSINPVNDLKIPGEVFDTYQKPFWVEEYIIGGEMRTMTNHRNSFSSYLIQYNFCCQSGTQMKVPEEKASLVDEVLLDADFMVDGIHCVVNAIKVSRSETATKNMVSVLLTVEVHFA